MPNQKPKSKPESAEKPSGEGVSSSVLFGLYRDEYGYATAITRPGDGLWVTHLNVGTERNELYAEALVDGLNALTRLRDAADAFAADQSGATDDRCGVQQPISVAEGHELCDAIKAADQALAKLLPNA